MAKIYSPVYLHLDVACEYSTDGGTIWTALAADTYKEFADADLQADNGRVKVRGTDSLVTFDKTKMKMNQTNYDSFHIKQANSITTLFTSFTFCTIKEIKLENIDSCINFTSAFSNANIKAFHGLTTTAVDVGLSDLFYNSSVNYIGNITAINSLHISGMFDGLIDNSYIGNLNFGERRNRSANYTFRNSEIKSFPYISDCGYGNGGSTTNYTFGTQHSRYGLYNSVALSVAGLNDYQTGFAMFHGVNTGKTKFSGFNLKLYNSADINGFASTNASLFGKRLFSGIVASVGSDMVKLGDAISASSGLYTENFKSSAQNTAIYAFMEDPLWIPEILEVDAYSNSSPSLHNKDSWYSRNMYTGYVSSGQMVEQDYVGGVEDNRPYSNYKVVASSNIWVSRNGNYAVQTGADVKIYDKSDVLLSTIVGVSPTCAELSNDGLHFYSVTGTLYNTAGASGQTITQTIVKYLISDGSTVSTKTIVSTDAHIVGLYNSGTEYNFAFVFTEFSGATATLSRADAYKNFDDVAVLKTTPMTHVVDYVFHSYGEDCEFNAIDKATTNLCCMFIR